MKFDKDLIAVFALSANAKGLAQDMYQALWACVTCVVVTVVVSLATQPKPESELVGLVYSLTEKPKEEHVAWYGRPFFWGMVSLAVFAILQWRFW
jgi:solute:Na+ symporter, SSS family